MNTDLYNTIMVNALPVVIAAAVALYKFIIQFLPAQKHAQLQSLVSNLDHIATNTVNAVEQFMGNEAGAVKKATASNDIAAILNAAGIRGVPPALIDNAIEAAVYSMNVFKPAAPPAPPVVSSETIPIGTPIVGVMPVQNVVSASSVATPQTVQNTSAS